MMIPIRRPFERARTRPALRPAAYHSREPGRCALTRALSCTLLATIGAVALLAGAAQAQLAGTYSISATPPGDYLTIQAAADALLAQGVSGPVTFEIAAGVWTVGAGTQRVLELVGEVAGASATDRITFTTAPGLDAEDVVLERSGPGAGGRTPVVALVGADFVTLRGLTFRGNMADSYNAGTLVGYGRGSLPVRGFTVQDCVFDGGARIDFGLGTDSTGPDVDTWIHGNRFRAIGGSIRIDNSSGSTDLVIEDNRIEIPVAVGANAATKAGTSILVNSATGSIIRRNVIDYAGGTGVYAIRVESDMDTLVEGNQILNATVSGNPGFPLFQALTGISLSNAAGKIVDNMLSAEVPTGFQAFHVDTGFLGGPVRILHNSVRANDVQRANRPLLFMVGNPELDPALPNHVIANNVFSFESSSVSSPIFQVTALPGWTAADPLPFGFASNVIYSQNGSIAQLDGLNVPTLADWQGTPGAGAGSTTERPEFVAPHDLHLAGCVLQEAVFIGQALPDPEILDDFDGELREPLVARMGADQASAALTGGLFAPAELYDFGAAVFDVATGDFDEDGNPDVALTRSDGFESGFVEILSNQGDGTLVPAASLSSSGSDETPFRVRAGDVDADGHLDLVSIIDWPGLTFLQYAHIYWGNGDNTFVGPETVRIPGFPPGTTDPYAESVSDLELADLDGDGDLDMVVTDFGTDFDYFVAVLCNSGDREFEEVVAGPDELLASSVDDIVLGDVDQDGRTDAVVAGAAIGPDHVYQTFGPGSCLLLRETESIGSIEGETSGLETAMALAPLDGDAFPDLIYDGDENLHPDEIFFRAGDGDRTFGPPVSIPLTTAFQREPGPLVPFDHDADGDLDIFVASTGSPFVQEFVGEGFLLVNDGLANFTERNVCNGSLDLPTPLRRVITEDLDGDGRDDLIGPLKAGTELAVLRSAAGALSAQQIDGPTATFDDLAIEAALAWSTPSEQQNAGFAVERRGDAADPWERIGTVPGVGTSETTQAYAFTDVDPPLSTPTEFVDYRLVQWNFDGSSQTTAPVSVDVPEPGFGDGLVLGAAVLAIARRSGSGRRARQRRVAIDRPRPRWLETPGCPRGPVRLIALASALLACAVTPTRADPASARALDETAVRLAPPRLDARPSTDAIESFLRQREYSLSQSQVGLQAPNRANRFRTYFEAEGIRVLERTGREPESLLALSLLRFGRGDAATPVEPGILSHHARRAEIERADGALVEWFENGEDGLEHGFTVARRLEGTAPLRFELDVSGARARQGTDGIRFDSESGRRLSYTKLVAFDARGHALPAKMKVASDRRLRIEVDDRDARYPVVVDPLLSETFDNEFESNQVDAELGSCVGSAGDVNADGYDDLLVGADRYDAGETDEGAVFLFLGGPGGPGDGSPFTADAVFESNQAGAGLGSDCDTAGDVDGDGYDDIVLGAWDYTTDPTSSEDGLALVFHGSPSGIASGDPSDADAILSLAPGETNADYGFAVAPAGDVNGDGYGDVLVGAMRHTLDSMLPEEGVVFVYHGGPNGITLGPGQFSGLFRSGQQDALLGRNGAIAGAGDVNGDGFDDVIIGAQRYDNGETDEGVALVYHGEASGFGAQLPGAAEAFLESNQAFAQFGFSVAGAGDVNGDGYADVVVGAFFYDGSENNSGGGFVYFGGPTGVEDRTASTADVTYDVGQASARLGYAVDSAGDVNGDGFGDVLISADLYDETQTNEGAAFVFLGGDPAPTTPFATLVPGQGSAAMGRAAAGAGDVDGDGFDDVVVGAFLMDSPQANEGQAFLYLGGSKGLEDATSVAADALLQSNQASAELGFNVAAAGDVNGDGFGDVIVGAPLYDAGESNEGAALVFLGSASGIADGSPSNVHAFFESNQSNADFGEHVASAGDVNGDGYADIVIGAKDWDASVNGEGAAFVFHGGPNGLDDGTPATADATIEGAERFDRLTDGCLASAGDVNRDGYADLLVGSAPAGAWIVHGGEAGLPSGSVEVADTTLATSGFLSGLRCSGAGDVNADGYADILLGAPFYDGGAGPYGGAFVLHGGPSGVPSGLVTALATTELLNDEDDTDFGASVSSAGDVNGDGFADVIVGEPDHDAEEGRALVFHGGPSGVPDATTGQADGVIESNSFGIELGDRVAGVGDVDGNGRDDVAVAASNGVRVYNSSPSGVGVRDESNPDAYLFTLAFGGSSLDTAGAGDTNGDGFADVIVGNPRSSSGGEFQEGVATLYLGNGPGRPGLARQLRGVSPFGPVQPSGLSHRDDGFRVELTSSSPRGLELGKVEVEVCAIPLSFGDVSCTFHEATAWGPFVGGILTQLVDVNGLSPGAHRWRARMQTIPGTGELSGVMPPPKVGPWRTPGASALGGRILVPEPATNSSLVAGAALLVVLQRRSRARRAATASSETLR